MRIDCCQRSIRRSNKQQSTIKMGASESKMSQEDQEVKVAVWNMLADGLSGGKKGGEFITRDPDMIEWGVRGPKVTKVLSDMFDTGFDVVVVLENDHPIDILEQINSATGKNIHCSAQRIRNNKNINSSYTQLLERNYPMNKEKTARTKTAPDGDAFNNYIKNASDCLMVTEWMNNDKPSNPLVPDVGPNDAYLMDYCNSVYWNADTVTAEPLFAEFNASNKTRKYKFYMGRGDSGFVQKFEKNGVEFNVLAAHLKSGEGPDEEKERVNTLLPILLSMRTLKNPIVLMDSNSSSHYRVGIEYNISHVIEYCGFVNAIPQDDDPSNPDNIYQSVKERSARGKQRQKFMELFFDTIDAILVLHGVNYELVPIDGVELYPQIYKDDFNEFRTNKLVRQRISNWGLDCKNNYNDDADETFKSYEKTAIRSSSTSFTAIMNKDETVTLKMMSSDEESRWGDDSTKNVYVGMSKYLNGNRKSAGIGDEGLKNRFACLYPNSGMPSDHPPIGAIVELKA